MKEFPSGGALYVTSMLWPSVEVTRSRVSLKTIIFDLKFRVVLILIDLFTPLLFFFLFFLISEGHHALRELLFFRMCPEKVNKMLFIITNASVVVDICARSFFFHLVKSRLVWFHTNLTVFDEDCSSFAFGNTYLYLYKYI